VTKAYRIRTLTDLLRVPIDRRAAILQQLMATLDALDRAGRSSWPNCEWIWIDDGKDGVDLEPCRYDDLKAGGQDWQGRTP
jgi:hypothetical protein